MDEAQFKDKLKELVKEFGGATEAQYVSSLIKDSKNQKKLEKSISELQESLDYLRICIKYQLFDLEATRRENEYLRKILGGNDSNQGPT
ncbi:MAG: hypothetical protein WC476_05860 [Phycisphaerae bacterium]